MTTLDTADAVDDFDVTAVVQTDRVHGSVYTSPEIFAREMDTIFKAGWVYGPRERDQRAWRLPDPHDRPRPGRGGPR